MANTGRDGPVPREQLGRWLRAGLRLPEAQAPFPWQERLLGRLLEGWIPAALDVPTGLGKTGVMAVWLVARAAGAPLPRRLVYVVDRRAVVDQATSVAEGLRELVEADEVLKRALGLDRPLPISTLRGQYVDNREWLEDPSAPAIVLGTVDMIGSRLLFGGYGVSRRMRPYQAGLLGVDALVVLDEAHLVPPFERLIEQIARGVDANGRSLRPEAALEPLVPTLRVLSLSATGRARRADTMIQLSDADRAHEVAARRLSARKRLLLREEVSAKELPGALAAEAWALSKGGASPGRIIVFCTSRDQAQQVVEELNKRAPKRESIDTELFVGNRRVFERELAARWLRERGFIAGSDGRPERATFVVATSAGEVGVDLDADHAVCDLVAWERMVQRFGRVNRRGDGDAQVIVVPTSRDAKSTAALEKYERWRAWFAKAGAGGTDELTDANELEESDDAGDDAEAEKKAPKLKLEERRSAELTLRREAAGELLQRLRVVHGAFDASPDGILELRERAAADAALSQLLRRATTPAPLHPPLTRALVEAWSMTSLEEHTGRPEVAPWIRGWPDEEDEPQTTLVWRAELPITERGQLFGTRALKTFRSAADPHLAERLETESFRVVEWLGKRLKTLRAPKPEDMALAPSERPLRSDDVVAVLLDPRDGRDRVVSAGDLSNREKRAAFEWALPGATLILDRRVGGLRDGLLADESDEPVIDVTAFEGDLQSPASPGTKRVVPFRIRRVTEADEAAAGGWRIEASLPVKTSDEGELEWLVVESLAGELAASEDGRAGAQRAQLLEEHRAWAEDEAHRLAERLGLGPEHAELLSLAARLHDEGKRAERWQRAFSAPSGGDPPFAKTTRRPKLSLLEGYRHELGSLPHAEAEQRVQALPPELQALCLHMIAAHHGSARPVIRTSGAPEPPIRLVERAQAIAVRFAALERRWGPWGLAWWEALLRAADQRASRRNDRVGGARG